MYVIPGGCRLEQRASERALPACRSVSRYVWAATRLSTPKVYSKKTTGRCAHAAHVERTETSHASPTMVSSSCSFSFRIATCRQSLMPAASRIYDALSLPADSCCASWTSRTSCQKAFASTSYPRRLVRCSLGLPA